MRPPKPATNLLVPPLAAPAADCGRRQAAAGVGGGPGVRAVGVHAEPADRAGRLGRSVIIVQGIVLPRGQSRLLIGSRQRRLAGRGQQSRVKRHGGAGGGVVGGGAREESATVSSSSGAVHRRYSLELASSLPQAQIKLDSTPCRVSAVHFQ